MEQTPKDVRALRNFGFSLLDELPFMLIAIFQLGAYTVVNGAAIYILLNRSNRPTKATLILLTALIIGFFLPIADEAIEAVDLFDGIRLVLTQDLDKPVKQRVHLFYRHIRNRDSIVGWFCSGQSGLQEVFADSIVVWRAWAIWRGRRAAVLMLPIVLLFATFATTVACGIMANIFQSFANFGGDDIADNLWNLLNASLALSLATNLAATAIIGYVAYQHRKCMKQTMGTSKRVGKILVLLTESGVVYCFIQAIYLCLMLLPDDLFDNNPRLSAFTGAWQLTMAMVSGMTPAIIVLIISHNRSMVQTTGNSSSFEVFESSNKRRLDGTDTRLSFAVRSVRTGDDGVDGLGRTRIRQDSIDSEQAEMDDPEKFTTQSV